MIEELMLSEENFIGMKPVIIECALQIANEISVTIRMNTTLDPPVLQEISKTIVAANTVPYRIVHILG